MKLRGLKAIPKHGYLSAWGRNIPDDAYGQAAHEAPEGARLVAPWPEDCQEVNGADGRRQVRSDGLDVREELRALGGVDDGDPDDGDYHLRVQKKNVCFRENT